MEEEECSRPKRSRKKRKPYSIEHRYVGTIKFLRFRGWAVWNRYATERDRDKALEHLQRKHNRWSVHQYYEYRKGEDGSVHE